MESNIISNLSSPFDSCPEVKQIVQNFYDQFTTKESNYLRTIIKVDSVDLIHNCNLSLQYNLEKEKMNVINESIVYHGTRVSNLPSICIKGFDLKYLGTVTGNKEYLGAGIYCSQRAEQSLLYVRAEIEYEPGSTTSLLVCKALLGKEYVLDTYSNYGKYTGFSKEMGYDSHCDPKGYEHVIFDVARLLPFCILNLISYPKK